MMSTLFRDNHLLVLNKRAGQLTVDCEVEGRAFLKQEEQKPGNVFLHAAHQIDRPVSGVLLMAKTSKALKRLCQAFRERKTHKCYWALVINPPKEPTGHCEHWLLRREFCSAVVPEGTLGAQKASLFFRNLGVVGPYTLLEIDLETGRYHQIRVQLAALGAPIVGDQKYGGAPWKAPGCIALHHVACQVPHPTRRELQLFQAPPPDSFLCGSRPLPSF